MVLTHWFSSNKKGLIIGFLFGALVAPFLATFGLVAPFFEWARPVLIGVMDMVRDLIPDVQTAPDTYSAPAYKWIAVLAANGLVYALVGGLAQSLIRRAKS